MATATPRADARPETAGSVVPTIRPMTRADICNVEPVTAKELKAILRDIGSSDDDSWTLTGEGLTCLA